MRNNLNGNFKYKILKLENDLTKANKIIEQQKITIKELQNKLNNYNNTINNYNNNINQKEIELNNIKSKLNNNFNINNNLSKNININEILCVNFISMDQRVHFAVGCTKNNIFAEIEEKLYKQYPEYRETNNTFIANGEQVLRFKTIEENKIGNGLPVTLIVPS